MNKKKKVNILIIGPDSPHVASFISRWNSEDVELEVISSGDKHIRVSKNHMLHFSLLHFWNFLITPLKIRRIAKRFQPDIVWMHQANSYSLYPILALKKRYPIVLTVWGSDVLVAPNQSRWIKKMTRYILQHVDAITADAHSLGEKALELSPKKNTPLYICQFGIQPIAVSLSKEQVIYSNRGHKSLYRIKDVIAAFHRFQQNQPFSWRLVIAGNGSETAALKQLVDELDLTEHVEFVGFLSPQENAAWYGRSELYISIPASDGTAVSLLEAMHYGCLPIVSDLPANREWITHGKNGYIATDLTIDFIKEALTIDPTQAKQENTSLIQSLATPEASSVKFQSVITDLLHTQKRSS